jgi:hypothetical protein
MIFAREGAAREGVGTVLMRMGVVRIAEFGRYWGIDAKSWRMPCFVGLLTTQ